MLPEAKSQQVSLALLTAAAVSTALAIILVFARRVQLPFHDEYGIVGWVNIYHYPKYQDVLLFLVSLVWIIFVVFLGYVVWRLLAWLFSTWLSYPPESARKLIALGSLPIHLLWLRLDWLLSHPLRWLFAIVSLSVLLMLCLILVDRKWAFSTRLFLPTLPTSYSGRAKRVRRNPYWYRVVQWWVVPLLLYAALYDGPNTGVVEMFHEGDLLAPLNQLLHGGLPFTDIYVQTGLFFNVYAADLAAILFEPSLASVRLLQGLLNPLGAVAIYLLGLTALRSTAAGALVLVLVVVSGPNWVSPRITLGVLAIALVMAAIQGKYHLLLLQHTIPLGQALRSCGTNIAMSGICVSLAFWYSVDIGVFSFAAIAGLLFGIGFLQPGLRWQRRSLPLVIFVSGVMLASLPVLIYFYFNNGLSNLLRNVYEQLAYQSAIWGLPYARLSGFFDLWLSRGNALTPWSLLSTQGINWFFPPLFFLLSTAYLCYRVLNGNYWNSTACLRYTLALLSAVFFFFTALGRSDPNHLIFGSVLFYLPLFMALERSLQQIWRGLRDHTDVAVWSRLSLLWWFFPVVFVMAYLGLYTEPMSGIARLKKNLLSMRLLQPYKNLQPGREALVGVPDKQAQRIRQVVDYIHRNTTKTDTVFDFSNQPAYLFFADRPSPSRYFIVAYAATSKQQLQVIQDLEQHRTLLVIYKTGGRRDGIDGLKNAFRHPLIANYLHTQYRQSAVVAGVTFLKRR